MFGKTVTVAITESLTADASAPLYRGCVKGYYQKGGRPQEAYIFGAPIVGKRFTGIVVATLTRPDGDVCWIVAPRRCHPCEPELRVVLPASEDAAVLSCHYEKSCGAVLFTEKGGVRHYLLVRNRSGYYGFPKGHMEAHENEHQTALREIEEETGLTTVQFLPHFREVNRYICRPHVKKQVVLFLARFDAAAAICPAFEIQEYHLSPFDSALRTVGHRNDKAILQTAEAFLAGTAEPQKESV